MNAVAKGYIATFEYCTFVECVDILIRKLRQTFCDCSAAMNTKISLKF